MAKCPEKIISSGCLRAILEREFDGEDVGELRQRIVNAI